MEQSKFKPALISGIIFGLLSSIHILIPRLPLVNCLCCGWLLICGAVAVKLYSNSTQGSVSTSQGALIGLMAGGVAALFRNTLGVITSLFAKTISNEEMREVFRQAFEQQRNLTSQQIDQAMKYVEVFLDHKMAFIFLGFLIGTAIMAGLGSLGGIIGAAFFNKGKTPPPTPPYGYGQSFGEPPKSSYSGQ